MLTLSVILSCLSILFTALPFIRSPAWWIRIFDFPRTQVAALCLISLALLYWYGDITKTPFILLGAVVAVAFINQLALIIKFSPLYPVTAAKASNQDNAFSILQVNVKMDNRKADKLKKLIARYKPDIISINEPDQWWADQLAELDAAYPYSMKKPLNNTYGMMLLSKFELLNKEINFIIDKDTPSFFTTVKLPSGKSFDLHCLHPEPPKPGTSAYERNTEIFVAGKRVRESAKAAIVVGDLNDVAWSYTTKRFAKLTGLLDPRVGRGPFNTYNAFIPLFRYPLDHFFYSKEFGLIELKKLPHFGSDHFPMFLRLNYEKANENVN